MAIDLLVWFFSIYPIDNVIPELHKRMKYMQIKQKHQQMLNICGNNGANATAKTIKKNGPQFDRMIHRSAIKINVIVLLCDSILTSNE